MEHQMWAVGGQLYVFGGTRKNGSDTRVVNTLWRFNPTTGLWTWLTGETLNKAQDTGTLQSTGTPGGRRGGSTFVLGDQLWLLGGQGYGNQTTDIDYLETLWRYDVSEGTWFWERGTRANQSGSGNDFNSGLNVSQGRHTSHASNKPGGFYRSGARAR
jgi:N-acetylneuraminic acid mutarotase